MKNKVQNTHTKRPSRLVVFAAIIGLGLGAMFTSTASAIRKYFKKKKQQSIAKQVI